MNVLVAYGSRHGATRGIADRIAQTLQDTGLVVTVQPVEDVRAVDGYDAFVIGSAAYMGRWLKEATAFVREHHALLASRPLWLFSSGPVGRETVDPKGRDVLQASRPHEFEEFGVSLRPRDERVFFGAYDPDAEPIGLAERLGTLFTQLPAVRKALPAGDYRDWAAIDAWAQGIAHQLIPVTNSTVSRA